MSGCIRWPEGGSLDSDQIAWLHSELAEPPRRALLLLSPSGVLADRTTGGSEYMEEMLDLRFRKPAVFRMRSCGTRHNYQRYNAGARMAGTRGRARYLRALAPAATAPPRHQTNMGAGCCSRPGSARRYEGSLSSETATTRHGFMRVEIDAHELQRATSPCRGRTRAGRPRGASSISSTVRSDPDGRLAEYLRSRVHVPEGIPMGSRSPRFAQAGDEGSIQLLVMSVGGAILRSLRMTLSLDGGSYWSYMSSTAASARQDLG